MCRFGCSPEITHGGHDAPGRCSHRCYVDDQTRGGKSECFVGSCTQLVGAGIVEDPNAEDDYLRPTIGNHDFQRILYLLASAVTLAPTHFGDQTRPRECDVPRQS